MWKELISNVFTFPPAATSKALENFGSLISNKFETNPLTLDLSKFGSGSLYSKFS